MQNTSVQKCKGYFFRQLNTPESSILLTSGLVNLYSVPTCLKLLVQATIVVYSPIEINTWSCAYELYSVLIRFKFKVLAKNLTGWELVRSAEFENTML